MPEPIQVQGLAEFRRELRKLGQTFPKELRAANKKAADIIAEQTRASFASRTGVAPKVAPSVKALAGQQYAAVRIGGAAYPYAMGAEFGSIQYKQFEAWRGSNSDAGYSLYPTIREKRPEIIDKYGDAVEELAKDAFPD